MSSQNKLDGRGLVSVRHCMFGRLPHYRGRHSHPLHHELPMATSNVSTSANARGRGQPENEKQDNIEQPAQHTVAEKQETRQQAHERQKGPAAFYYPEYWISLRCLVTPPEDVTQKRTHISLRQTWHHERTVTTTCAASSMKSPHTVLAWITAYEIHRPLSHQTESACHLITKLHTAPAKHDNFGPASFLVHFSPHLECCVGLPQSLVSASRLLLDYDVLNANSRGTHGAAFCGPFILLEA